MLNCSAIHAMSTSVLETLPSKLDIKRHSPSTLDIISMLSRVDCSLVVFFVVKSRQFYAKVTLSCDIASQRIRGPLVKTSLMSKPREAKR